VRIYPTGHPSARQHRVWPEDPPEASGRGLDTAAMLCNFSARTEFRAHPAFVVR
jgi:hypothetical protein